MEQILSNPLAQIHIKNLRLRAIVGVYDFEKENPQDLILNIHFDYDASVAAKSDQLDHAIDYHALSKRIASYVQESRHELLESMAAKVLELVMDDRRAIHAQVCVEKPAAIPGADGVCVRLASKAPPA